jgi:phytoene dehydrogenase-like protein
MYDVIVIGAGMSGLVCGCYLAKSGMKVLIVEQHYKPGGYCSSFNRKGFTFDAAAHSFGSNRKGGNLNTVLRELDLDHRLRIKRYDPSDILVTPDCKITFWTDHDRLITELQKVFPRETRIRDFITFLANPRPIDVAAMRNKTFQDLLDLYFTDDKLKAILSFPLFGNGGLPPALMSAFTGSKIFTEFVVDGGYYPEGGMQALPDALAMRFQELGGTLRCSSLATQITVNDQEVSGVVLESGEKLLSKYVISNCDAKQTFLKLLEHQTIDKRLVDKLNTMTSSLSMFIIYIGLDKYFCQLPPPGSTLWFLPHYDLQAMYEIARDTEKTDLTKYLLRISPDGRSLLAMANTSFKNGSYWSQNKKNLLESFIAIIEQTTVPSLSQHIMYKEAATPYTLFRYTLNDQGAAYGWESTPCQLIDSDFRKPPLFRGLYLTGHWTTYAQGLAGVVYLGYDIAKSVLKNEKIKELGYNVNTENKL